MPTFSSSLSGFAICSMASWISPSVRFKTVPAPMATAVAASAAVSSRPFGPSIVSGFDATFLGEGGRDSSALGGEKTLGADVGAVASVLGAEGTGETGLIGGEAAGTTTGEKCCTGTGAEATTRGGVGIGDGIAGTGETIGAGISDAGSWILGDDRLSDLIDFVSKSFAGSASTSSAAPPCVMYVAGNKPSSPRSLRP